MLSLFKSTLNILKKVFLVVTVFLVVITLFFYFINKDKISLFSSSARVNPIEKNRTEIYKVINDKKINSTKEGKLTIALYRGMMCSTVGEGCTNNPKDGDRNFQKSFFGFISKLVATPFINPPASGVYWVYSGLQNSGFIPKTMASEGIGFAAVKPFSNLWKIFRDFSYMLLVIILIAIGFMIMFRAKINPQTVISVENALPKIVIALILITFSFAIAGFLIDLMYVLIAFIISLLSNNNTYYDAGKYTNDYLTASPWKVYSTLYSGLNIMTVGNALLSLTGNAVQFTVRTGLGLSGAVLFGHFFKPILEGLVEITDGIANQAITGINLAILGAAVNPFIRWFIVVPLGIFIGFFLAPQFIIGVLVWFTVVLLFIKIIFTLFNSYLKIFLYIIFAPILLLFEAVPTGKSVFSWWFKSLIAELLYFPVLITLLLVGNIIQTIATSGTQMWTPPFLYGIDPNTYSILIGMMILLLIPDFMKLFKGLLGVKDLPINFGLGTFFGGAGAAVGGGVGILGQFGSLALAMNYLPGGKKLLAKIAGDKAPPIDHQEVEAAAGGPKLSK